MVGESLPLLASDSETTNQIHMEIYYLLLREKITFRIVRLERISGSKVAFGSDFFSFFFLFQNVNEA